MSNNIIKCNEIWEAIKGTLVSTGTRHVIVVDIKKKPYDKAHIIYFRILGDNTDHVYSNFQGYFTQNFIRTQ